ncbi:MAG: DMT family transporter [Hyphomonadaceae bacterium]|nr:DMT family transporter [Hyphomonadaceae bacterium]
MTDLAAAYHRLSANARGALWMLGSALAFTLMTTLVKFLGDGYSPALQAFYRQLAGLVVLAPVILRDPRGAFAAKRHDILLFRATAGTLAVILSFYAYQAMPLAEANALSFTRTLWIVPLAIFALRETVGPWRIGATLVGFVGVLIMLRPSAHFAVSWPAISALGGAALFATTVTGMKVLTRDHSLTALTVWSAALGFVFVAPFALMEWRWPTAPDFALLAAMGVAGLGAQVCYIKGMSLGDAAAMSPIDYTRLVFALIVGFALFHETPDLITMAGAGIVVAATLVITLREQRATTPPTARE